MPNSVGKLCHWVHWRWFGSGVAAVVCAVVLSDGAGRAAMGAIRVDEPARIELEIRDAGGVPVANGAVVVTSREGEIDLAAPRRFMTDGQGKVSWPVRIPEALVGLQFDWDEWVVVEHEGHLPYRARFTAFPGARIREEVALTARKATLLRMLDPKGAPLAHRRFEINYVWSNSSYREAARLDHEGQYLFVHQPLPQGFSLSGGSWKRELEDVPEVVIELTETELSMLPPVRTLRGRLLMADGVPAAGWFVALDAVATGAGGSTHGPMRTFYSASELRTVDPDGGFVSQQTEDQLIVLSPEGIPHLFPLQPRSWTGAVHEVTFRLPEVRRVHKGRMTYEDGKPAADVAFFVTGIRSGSFHWDFRLKGMDGQGRQSLAGTTAQDGTRVGGLATDGQGRYQIPCYFGTQVECRPGSLLWPAPWDMVSHTNVVLGPRQKVEPDDVRKVTLRVVDEQGVGIEGVRIGRLKGYSGGKHLVSTAGGWKDSAGWTFLLQTNLDRLELEVIASGWGTYSGTVLLPGADNELPVVTLPDSSRLRPLEGRVLDPDGMPVVRVRVILWDKVETHDRRQLGLTTETDAEGRFRFEAAPDICALGLHPPLDGGGPERLPGWFDPSPITRENRNITIRLQRSGSVRVRLPVELPEAPDSRNLILLLQDPIPAGQLRYWPSYEAESGTLVERFVRPGTYVLGTHDPKPWRNVSNLTVVVQAGEEAVVDLTDADHLPVRSQPLVWNEVLVWHKGAPFSGARVSVYPMERDYGFRARADLSDDGGRVRFSEEEGKEVVVVARVPGRFVGWTRATVRKEGAVRVELERSGSLEVRVKPGRELDASYFMGSVSMADVANREGQTLFHALGLSSAYGFVEPEQPVIGWLVQDGPLTWIAEDLPVGRTYQLRVEAGGRVPAERTVVLGGEGPSVRVVELELESARPEPKRYPPGTEIIDPNTGLPFSEELLVLPDVDSDLIR